MCKTLWYPGHKTPSRFLQTPVFTVIPKSACAKTADIDTIGELWHHLASSMNALFYNFHPMLDTALRPWPTDSFGDKFKGSPVLPYESFGVVWDILGDLEHHANVLGLPHWKNPNPCWLCHGSQLQCMDFRPAAAWKSSLVTPEESFALDRPHPVFKMLREQGVSDKNSFFCFVCVMIEDGTIEDG